MNPFISPIAIQSFCDFTASLASIFLNIAGVFGVLIAPVTGIGQQILPSPNQLISDICFVVVAQATGAAS